MKELLCTDWGKTITKRWYSQTITMGLVLAGSLYLSAMPNVWINEIHYDNDGGDVGERIEVAGQTGTDLNEFTLVLYNGSNGDDYLTISLSGILPDQENGFGTLTFSATGIQNGGPDGIALVDDESTVIQFLSYEGSFTATDGPANGIMSTDIVVSEPASTPLGNSLQLIGTGSTYEDFMWSGPLGDTFGAINDGQQFPQSEPPPPPPTNTVPDGGSSLALLTLTFLGLIYRSSHRQGGAALPEESTLR